MKRIILPLALTGTIAAGVVEVLPKPSASADRDSTSSVAVAHAAKASSRTAKAVKAAKAFKASLSASQRSTLQFSFSDSAKEAGWSNLPVGIVARNGVKLADLNASQLAKLHTLLKTVLSSQGLADEEATRKADTYLSENGGGGQYGEGVYYVAFFGTPSKSKKWTVQFGGHHLAIHMTFSGKRVDNTPYFVGVEPKASFKEGGKTYQPMKDEAKHLFGAVQALTTAQKAKAKLSQSFDDVLVGPQKDGDFPTRQGVTVSSLSKKQRALVTKAIKSYLFDEPTAQAEARLKVYTKAYKKTSLAYSGTPDGTTTGGYVRLQGPRLWLEIATQNGIVFRSTTHYHSIERDRKSDYGA